MTTARSGRRKRAWVLFERLLVRAGLVMSAGFLLSALGGWTEVRARAVADSTSAALDALRPLGLPYGAYANGFSEITPHTHGTSAPEYGARHDLSPERYTDFALGWVAQGATLVGGCCEVGPAHIRHLHSRLRAEGHTIA